MRRILVVDDDLHVGQAIRVRLKEHGFRVSAADGGPGGLAAPDNATFDLMIVDAFMPHMRGFEAMATRLGAPGCLRKPSWNEDWKGDQRAARLGICSSIGRRCPATTR